MLLGYTLADLDRELNNSPDGRRFLAMLDTGAAPAHDPALGKCVVWTGARDSDGYGVFKGGDRGQTVNAHAWLYRRLVGPVPEGRQLDHLCHDPDWCTPGRECAHRPCVIHTDPVTHRENWARGGSRTVYEATKEFCDGLGGEVHHPLSGPNLKLLPDGRRRCRECDNRRDREYRERQRALAAHMRHLGIVAAGQLTLL